MFAIAVSVAFLFSSNRLRAIPLPFRSVQGYSVALPFLAYRRYSVAAHRLSMLFRCHALRRYSVAHQSIAKLFRCLANPHGAIPLLHDSLRCDAFAVHFNAWLRLCLSISVQKIIALFTSHGFILPYVHFDFCNKSKAVACIRQPSRFNL